MSTNCCNSQFIWIPSRAEGKFSWGSYSVWRISYLQQLCSSILCYNAVSNCLPSVPRYNFDYNIIKKMFHATFIPGEYVLIILTRWEPSLTSCTCCTCGSATTLVSWSEVMSCLLFGCSERTLLVTFVSCGNRKTKDSVSSCWKFWRTPSRSSHAGSDQRPKEPPHHRASVGRSGRSFWLKGKMELSSCHQLSGSAGEHLAQHRQGNSTGKVSLDSHLHYPDWFSNHGFFTPPGRLHLLSII